MMNQSRNWTLVIASISIVAIILGSSAIYLVITQTGRSSPSGQGPLNQVGKGDTSTANLTRTITVSGTGQVSFVPSEALVDVSVVTDNSTAVGATTANAVATSSVIKALNSIGIANSSIETMGYNLSPNYNYNQQPPALTGYAVTNSLQVNVTGVSSDQLGLKSGQVIDTAVKAGANQASLQFTVPNQMMAKLNNEALQQAVLSASGQAQTIASALGVSITGVISASEGSGFSPYPQTVFGAVAAVTMTTTVGLTPIVPGTLTASATVQVTYAIS